MNKYDLVVVAEVFALQTKILGAEVERLEATLPFPRIIEKVWARKSTGRPFEVMATMLESPETRPDLFEQVERIVELKELDGLREIHATMLDFLARVESAVDMCDGEV